MAPESGYFGSQLQRREKRQKSGRDYKLTDSSGLFLFVSSAGTKSWQYRYRHRGQEKTLSLGRYPDAGLAAARLARDDARRQVLDGKNPAWEKKRKRQDDFDATRATFRKLGNEWLAEHEPLWSAAKASESLQQDGVATLELVTRTSLPHFRGDAWTAISFPFYDRDWEEYLLSALDQ